MKIIDNKSISKFLAEDYFAIQVLFNNYDKDRNFHNIFSYIRKDNSSLLEFTFDPSTPNTITSLLLVASDDYKILQSNISLPTSYAEATLANKKQFDISTNTFHINVFVDGLEFVFSENEPQQIIKTGQVYFILGAKETIQRIIISDLTKADIKHIISELTINEQDEGK